MRVFKSNGYFALATLSLFSALVLVASTWAREDAFRESPDVEGRSSQPVLLYASQEPAQQDKEVTLSCYLKDVSGYAWYDTLKINFNLLIVNGRKATLEGNILKWSIPDGKSKNHLFASYDMNKGRYRGIDNLGDLIFEGECKDSPLFD